MRTKLIALALVVFGIILAFGAWQRKGEIAKLQSEGETAPGIIETAEWKSRRGVKTHTFNVAFTTKAGAKVTKSFTVHDDDFLGRFIKDEKLVEDRVEVRYLASDPQSALLAGDVENPSTNLYIGIALIPVGLIVTFFAFRKKKDDVPAVPTAASA